VLFLYHVRSDDPFADLPRRRPFRCLMEKVRNAPWIARADYGEWADYLATVSTSRLSGLRRKRRRLAELGDLDVELHQGPVSEALIDSLLAHKKAWMFRHGLSNGWLGRSGYRAFLLALTSGADSRDGLRLFSLRMNGTPIAFQLNAVDVRRVEFLIGAFDEQWARYSPGQILMLECIRWSFERGLDYDFRIGDEAYKSTWARRHTPTFDCKVALSCRGTAAVWLLRLYRQVRRLRALWHVPGPRRGDLTDDVLNEAETARLGTKVAAE
jgi:CelD/BcsL family acetyltransferase involved in cellulose biosynthesis